MVGGVMNRLGEKLIIGCVGLVVGITGFTVLNSKSKADILAESALNQSIARTELEQQQAVNIEKFIESVDSETELIVMTEYGASEIAGNKVGNDWMAWMTTSDIIIHAGYKASVSIPTSKIYLFEMDNVVYASFNPQDFIVHAVEITDKHYLKDYDFFPLGFTDSELIAMEQLLVEDIKRSILVDDANMTRAEDSLEFYLYQLAEAMDVNLVVRR